MYSIPISERRNNPLINAVKNSDFHHFLDRTVQEQLDLNISPQLFPPIPSLNNTEHKINKDILVVVIHSILIPFVSYILGIRKYLNQYRLVKTKLRSI